jgi:hypothetical protein
VSFEVIQRAWVRLNDRRINTAFVLPAKHLLFGAIQTEDTTFAKMRVRINYFCLSHKPLLLLVRIIDRFFRRKLAVQQYQKESSINYKSLNGQRTALLNLDVLRFHTA